MSKRLYPRLAWEGIRKNRRLYVPYLLTGSVMVMMYYILGFLRESPALEHMGGGTALSALLPLACAVIAAFSALFLFYTNSFLIRQRHREFGLYNILGMGKGEISRIMAWESVFAALLALAPGLIAGIAFSKAAELMLLNLLGLDILFTLALGPIALKRTVLVYGVLYVLLLAASVIRVGRARPLELMHSSRVGERAPKGNLLYALAGAALLTCAYWLAVTIQDPLDAMVWFFAAVLMVMGGTYLLFMAGSVAVCRLLQRNKRYYYRPRHFVSVSSMVYRMKRNGAGLASICILLTMVLVMIASSACLYFGMEDALLARYPRDINVRLEFNHPEGIMDGSLEAKRQLLRQHGAEETDLQGVRFGHVYGLLTEEGITVDLTQTDAADTPAGTGGYLSVIPLADYNAAMGTQVALDEDQCLLYCRQEGLQWDAFTLEGCRTLQVKIQLDRFPPTGDTADMVTPNVFVVVRDLFAYIAPVIGLENAIGDSLMAYEWRCGFDLADADAQQAAVQALWDAFDGLDEQGIAYSFASQQAKRTQFREMYGSLFFIGIMLSGVFLLAAVLIIYYKQISEGYEDQGRFAIMQKVGMTKQDIRASINSQMLTVFYLPLVFAGIHLAFAFPFIQKIFKTFAYDNIPLSIGVNLGCFVAFGLFYALVYKITSSTYYAIVSGGRSE